jgi:hypothetical protein
VISSKIVGWVDAGIAGSANVSAQTQGESLRATHPDAATGRFELAWVPTGTYQLVITAPARANAVMTGVPVTSAGATTIGSDTARLSPPAAAASAAVIGMVSPSADADVRALQTLADNTPVEVAYAGADATSGAYSMTLPRGELYTTPYITPDMTTVDKYTIEARSGGATKRTDPPIMLPLGGPLDFVFP